MAPPAIQRLLFLIGGLLGLVAPLSAQSLPHPTQPGLVLVAKVEGVATMTNQGTAVTVTFVMNAEGRIVSIGVEDTTADEAATRVCVTAITNRVPYGPWTDEMTAVLGDRQEMTFRFLYQ